jgi:hypothetical protein
MNASFHLDAGPFSICVDLDDAGIHMSRNSLGRFHTESIRWNKISGATLVRPAADVAETQPEQRLAQVLGPEAVARFHELQGKVGQICIAYRDERNRLRQTEVPALLTDERYMQEFQSRLGAKWLGETEDRQKVDKKLHTNPGLLKTLFVLLALFGALAVAGVIGTFGLLGPVFNFMSIQKMLLDLQDGNLSAFAYRLACYVALLVLGYFLHRVLRTRLDAMQRPRAPRRPLQP